MKIFIVLLIYFSVYYFSGGLGLIHTKRNWAKSRDNLKQSVPKHSSYYPFWHRSSDRMKQRERKHAGYFPCRHRYCNMVQRHVRRHVGNYPYRYRSSNRMIKPVGKQARYYRFRLRSSKIITPPARKHAGYYSTRHRSTSTMDQLPNVNCTQFFPGDYFPVPPYIDRNNKVVKLCQNDDGNPSTIYYATLFSTTDKIPIYSANVVNINDYQSKNEIISSSKWKRVATSLCNENPLPSYSFLSNIGSQRGKKCGDQQALDSDYYNNQRLERGHLTPDKINAKNPAKQLATYTLTNAAPQYKAFNGRWYHRVEKITEEIILRLSPGENVYIMTGTYGIGTPPELNGVRVPAYFWKAVCYPGNPAWGFAIIRQNVYYEPSNQLSGFMTLANFAKRYSPYEPFPFGKVCIDADLPRAVPGMHMKKLDHEDEWIYELAGNSNKRRRVG